MNCIGFHCSTVTKLSVGSNFDLQYLLKVKLCRPSISEDSCELLLKRMSQNNATLRSFGCSAISVSQLDILINKFLNLTQVNLVSFTYGLLWSKK